MRLCDVRGLAGGGGIGSTPQAEQILLLALLASMGCYCHPLPAFFLAAKECQTVAKLHCLKVYIIYSGLRYVLQVLPSSLLGAVFGLVCGS
jgi:hypothetical protein